MGKPKYVAYPPILDPSQRTGAIGGLYGQGLEFLNEGAQQYFQPSFDFAFDVMQPFSEQISPFTDASLRQSRQSFLDYLPYQEQLFQKQGAFFTPDLGKARGDLITRQGQQEQDFLTKLMFGLTETGVGLGQNLLNTNLQASQMGGSWLDALLQQQFGTERANVNLENTKRAQDQANQFDWGKLMQSAAPFANLIPGVGPFISAGLSIGGGALSQSQGMGDTGMGFGDYFSNMNAYNSIQDQLGLRSTQQDQPFGGGYGTPIMTSMGQGWRGY